ncbi:MAG: type II toxin-antitoxin system HicB family antitoxin [Gemmatimonadaceae bacterium]
MKYKIVLQHTDEGYSVSVPGLPGCWSQGATESEAVSNVREAITEYLAVRDDLVKGADATLPLGGRACRRNGWAGG